MGEATPYAKAELKYSPDRGGFQIRITWQNAVRDRRLTWFAFQANN